jgi:hypothetical protein
MAEVRVVGPVFLIGLIPLGIELYHSPDVWVLPWVRYFLFFALELVLWGAYAWLAWTTQWEPKIDRETREYYIALVVAAFVIPWVITIKTEPGMPPPPTEEARAEVQCLHIFKRPSNHDTYLLIGLSVINGPENNSIPYWEVLLENTNPAKFGESADALLPLTINTDQGPVTYSSADLVTVRTESLLPNETTDGVLVVKFSKDAAPGLADPKNLLIAFGGRSEGTMQRPAEKIYDDFVLAYKCHYLDGLGRPAKPGSTVSSLRFNRTAQ